MSANEEPTKAQRLARRVASRFLFTDEDRVEFLARFGKTLPAPEWWIFYDDIDPDKHPQPEMTASDQRLCAALFPAMFFLHVTYHDSNPKTGDVIVMKTAMDLREL